jgi:hypothetical protein
VRSALRQDVVHRALAVLRHEGIEVHETCDALRHAIGGAGNHHAAVAVAEQHHAIKLLRLEHADNVLDMRLEVYRGAGEVRPLPEAGEGRRVDLVTGAAQQGRQALPAPAAVPRAVDQNDIHSAALS